MHRVRLCITVIILYALGIIVTTTELLIAIYIANNNNNTRKHHMTSITKKNLTLIKMSSSFHRGNVHQNCYLGFLFSDTWSNIPSVWEAKETFLVDIHIFDSCICPNWWHYRHYSCAAAASRADPLGRFRNSWQAQTIKKRYYVNIEPRFKNNRTEKYMRKVLKPNWVQFCLSDVHKNWNETSYIAAWYYYYLILIIKCV